MKYIVGLVQSHIILLLDQLARLLSNSPLLFWTATTSTAMTITAKTITPKPLQPRPTTN